MDVADTAGTNDTDFDHVDNRLSLCRGVFPSFSDRSIAQSARERLKYLGNFLGTFEYFIAYIVYIFQETIKSCVFLLSTFISDA